MSEIKTNQIYKHYLSTQAFTDGQGLSEGLKWSHSYFKAHYVKLLPLNKESEILDVGCGYGRYLWSLNKLGYKKCYGIDISEEQVDYAKNVLQLNNVERIDALSWLEDKESFFDVIFAIDILEHFNTYDLVDLCQKIFNSLKPGGRFIVQVPNGASLINPIVYGDLTHVRAFTVESIKQLFLLAGFIPPFEYYEIPPHNFNSIHILKNTLWRLFLRPIINFVVVATYHRMSPAIYTNNFIAVAHKL
jgi:2-polyprenyl-3-methyl-5-hydroxy-6-metoxy-1,4-benzoquinol methylase